DLADLAGFRTRLGLGDHCHIDLAVSSGRHEKAQAVIAPRAKAQLHLLWTARNLHAAWQHTEEAGRTKDLGAIGWSANFDRYGRRELGRGVLRRDADRWRNDVVHVCRPRRGS